MKIKDKKISLDSKPFIIAEMSGNHNQSLERALKLVRAAAESGADAIKLQTYTPDTMTFNSTSKEFYIKDKESLWDGRSMFDLYNEAHTPWEWHEEIFDYANSLGLISFSSPFDDSAVDFLEELDVPAYKIASFECIDSELLKKVAATGKPIIISTGMATISEIEEAVLLVKSFGCEDLALLKCTSTYPANPENTNLKTIPSMRRIFDCEVGLSDHTMGIGVACAAISSEATIIEKHFTLDREDGGVDSTFSLEPKELEQLVIETERAWQSKGKVKFGGTKAEEKPRERRRSLYFMKDLQKGHRLKEADIKRVRPGNGLEPKYQQIIVGMKITKDVKEGEPITWKSFK
tara:strand:- start:3884 stop:4927 length:1044 start_codon:yes stop_codon:yes gene_type:complete